MKKLLLILAIMIVCGVEVGAVACPTTLQGLTASEVANYGCWGGNYFWAASDTTLYKITLDDTIAATYDTTTEAMGTPLIMAYDGRYLWVASYDSTGILTKFDPQTGHSVSHWTMNPDSNGTGGIQGIIWDGSYLWLGVAENGYYVPPVDYSGRILKFNTTTYAIELTITAQTNVNGLAVGYSGGKEYILGACDIFWSKIDAITGTYTTTNDGVTSYRITTDNTYVYLANHLGGTIKKFNLSTGAYVTEWVTGGTYLNSITYDGAYLWTCGNDGVVSVQDTIGISICNITNSAQSDVVFDGMYMWGIQTNGGSDAAVIKFSDKSVPTIVTTWYTGSSYNSVSYPTPVVDTYIDSPRYKITSADSPSTPFTMNFHIDQTLWDAFQAQPTPVYPTFYSIYTGGVFPQTHNSKSVTITVAAGLSSYQYIGIRLAPFASDSTLSYPPGTYNNILVINNILGTPVATYVLPLLVNVISPTNTPTLDLTITATYTPSITHTSTLTRTSTLTSTPTITVTPTSTITPTTTPYQIWHHNTKDSDHGVVTISNSSGTSVITLSAIDPYFRDGLWNGKVTRDIIMASSYLAISKTAGTLTIKVLNRADSSPVDCTYDPQVVLWNVWRLP